MAEVVTMDVCQALVRLAKLRLTQQAHVVLHRGQLYTMSAPLVRDVSAVLGVTEDAARAGLEQCITDLDLGALRDSDDASKIVAVRSDWF